MRLKRNNVKRKQRGTSVVRRVIWKDPAAELAARKAPLPAPYRECAAPLPELKEWFVVGNAVVAAVPMQLSHERGAYEFVPLQQYYGDPASAPIPVGSLLVYTGPVRSRESKYVSGKRRTITVIKYTFITPLGRCIMHDLDMIKAP